MRARRPSFKGHCMMCALNTDCAIRGMGRAAKTKPSEQRKFGRSRRIGRREIPVDQLQEC